MTVLIVDSSTAIIERLASLISETGNVKTILKAETGKAVTELLKVSKPDVVLLDIGLPGNKSFDLIWEIKKSNAATAVIVLSIHTNVHMEEQCNSLGADYFFDKYHEFEKIPGVINSIAANKKLAGQ